MNLTNANTSLMEEGQILSSANPAEEEPPSPASGAAEFQLPEHPVVVIQPSKSWVALGLRDVWAYRELLYFLTWRDVKVRYKQTVMGAGWAILQPLFLMIIATLVFGRIAGLDQKTAPIPYPLFAYAGLLLWTFFANALSNSGNSLVGSSNLITKVYFPRMIIPGAAVAAGAVDLAIACVLLIGLMIYYQVAISISIVLLVLPFALVLLLALGIGMWMSALNVKYRDIRYALPFLIQLGIYVSPVFYPSQEVPDKWRWLMLLNPLTGILDNFRAALFNLPFNWLSLGISALITFGLLIYAAYDFRRMEKSFADVV